MGRKKFKEYGVRDVLEAMEAVVEEKGPDFVYYPLNEAAKTCHYTDKGAPGCLVGHVLIRLGAPLNVLQSADPPEGDGLGVEMLIEKLAPTWGTLGYSLTDEAIHVLVVAQNAQDVLDPWGEALDKAKVTASELMA